MDDPERMIALNKAADQLGYTASGLYKVVERTRKGKPGPKIRFFQIGSGPIKFKQAWLDDFITENSIMPHHVQVQSRAKYPKRTAGGSPVEVCCDWAALAS